jgi:hypothetical protein
MVNPGVRSAQTFSCKARKEKVHALVALNLQRSAIHAAPRR